MVAAIEAAHPKVATVKGEVINAKMAFSHDAIFTF
jgi:hypothetical protein